MIPLCGWENIPLAKSATLEWLTLRPFDHLPPQSGNSVSYYTKAQFTNLELQFTKVLIAFPRILPSLLRLRLRLSTVGITSIELVVLVDPMKE